MKDLDCEVYNGERSDAILGAKVYDNLLYCSVKMFWGIDSSIFGVLYISL